jgi:ribosomal protein L11 methyltransferase
VELEPPGALVITVAAARVEMTSDVLWFHGCDAIGEVELGPTTTLTAGFATVGDARRAQLELGGSVETITDDAWMDAWKAYAEPVLIADRMLIQPSWMTRDIDAPVVIELDAARAFGAGTHPSTRLILEVLCDEDLHGRDVLDVGCGSGILSIAAVALGAGRAIATDVDPIAVSVTAMNAERNGVADRVQVYLAQPELGTEGLPNVDVVVANIGHGALLAMLPDLLAAAPVVVLSGLLETQAADLASRCPGLVSRTRILEGWQAVVSRRTPTPHARSAGDRRTR